MMVGSVKTENAGMDRHSVQEGNGRRTRYFVRVRAGLIVTLFGFGMFLLGARPSVFGLDRSPVIGFVQVAVLLVGLAIMCIGGYLSLVALWNHHTPSIAADIGLRLVSTGYVVSVFSGMADVFGFGSHPLPGVPYFGIWQATGVMIGEFIIAAGFLMLIPYSLFFSKKPGKDTQAGD
jgi:hypothetical protein